MAGWGEWPQQEANGLDNFDLNLVPDEDPEPEIVHDKEIIPVQNPIIVAAGEEKPVSMVVNSYENDSSAQTCSSMNTAQMEDLEPVQLEPIVLALPVDSLNFMHLEIPKDALMNDAEIALAANQDLQVGFVQLPDNLEMDPGWATQIAENKKRPHPDSIHLWGKHFAPIGYANGPLIPGPWSDFFNITLMDPIRVGWAKSSWNQWAARC
jgi:hypothetical protein